ncbi:P22 coat - protein 5 family protein [Pseudomonas sp. 14P_8.1_Bac3]|uniref:P22 coat - protein 5 family protein n=1 Tax=Pseudomonas sp. 14P_8.1_Bac3 TaxID=2971621 RepID=UPI0021C99FD2|nr:P22 coat - protein 5 family protein [Pseudomonas sp. 14P_8.1_Bac3]MCU1758718.1 P22 coat - protein 5 family protein [Pseudomonas sp. 14P_8.1_Bac3]
MANIFTALQPVLYSAAQEVSNEPFGVISAITADFDDKGVAVGDAVKVPVAPIRAVKSFTPSMAMPTGDDATADGVSVQITNTDYVDWNLTGEQIKSLENAGSDKEWVRQMIAQGMRALRNKAEVAACTAIKVGATRAVGTAGTNPFASDINIIPDVRKVLFDNGAPMADLQLCIDSSAGTSARKLGIIQQAYQAGNDQERRSGDLLRQFGFSIRESAGITAHTKGTGTAYVTSGSTGIDVPSVALVTGSGTVLAGDVVTFAADTGNKYVVNTGVAAPGTITLGRPGAQIVIPTANAMTIGNNYVPNLAFERSAVVGVMRAPIIPANPIITQTMISDKFGMTYLLLQIAGYGMTTWQLHIAYGFKVVQGEHVAVVMG